jgi:hypothetical protein
VRFCDDTVKPTTSIRKDAQIHCLCSLPTLPLRFWVSSLVWLVGASKVDSDLAADICMEIISLIARSVGVMSAILRNQLRAV